MPDETVVHIIDDDDAVRESLSFAFDIAGIKTRTYEFAGPFPGIACRSPRPLASSPISACRR